MAVIAIEGIDGSGKTTQAKMLVDRLKKEGYDATYMRPIFIILSLLHLDPGRVFSPRITNTSSIQKKKHYGVIRVLIGLLGYLYALVTYLLLVYYSRNDKLVICDRYFYQFFFDLLGSQSNFVIDFFPRPDITFFLDSNVNKLYSRMTSQYDLSISREYYLKILDLYKNISRKHKFIVVDGDMSREDILNFIYLKLVEKLLRG